MSILVTRRVTGTEKDAAGNAYANVPLYFKAEAVFGADGVVVSTESVKVMTGSNGAFSVDLFTVNILNAFVRYRVILAGGDVVTIDVRAGSAVTLDELTALGSLVNSDLAAIGLLVDIYEVDGGSAGTMFMPDQVIDGGTA